jgi:hypothetical protein
MPATNFTYIGTSTAAAMTTGVLNTALALAAEKSALSTEGLANAMALTSAAPIITSPARIEGVIIPDMPAIEPITPSEAQDLYNATAEAIKTWLTAQFTNFFTQFFPLGNELVAAQSWISRALTTGGSGINIAVEDQLWQRERDRTLRDAARAEDEQITAWAARGFPLPTGALAHSLLQIQRETLDKTGESSRAQAIKSFDAELENARLAVDKAIMLRSQAITSASEYIRTLVLGPQLGVSISTALLDARVKVATLTTELYRAQITGLELPVRVATTEAELTQRTNEANIKAQLETLGQRVTATVAAAQMLGQQASAILNGFHASVGVAGQESL